MFLDNLPHQDDLIDNLNRLEIKYTAVHTALTATNDKILNYNLLTDYNLYSILLCLISVISGYGLGVLLAIVPIAVYLLYDLFHIFFGKRLNNKQFDNFFGFLKSIEQLIQLPAKSYFNFLSLGIVILVALWSSYAVSIDGLSMHKSLGMAVFLVGFIGIHYKLKYGKRIKALLLSEQTLNILQTETNKEFLEAYDAVHGTV